MKSFPGLVMNVSEKLASNGKPYLTFDLLRQDGTRCPAKMWGVTAEEGPKENAVYLFKGREDSFNGQTYIVVEQFKADPDVPAVETFLPRSRLTTEDLTSMFGEYVETIADRDMRNAVKFVFLSTWMEPFFRAPGASAMHHACVGGLAHHTIGVASIICGMPRFYRNFNRDIALAGALLHDVGKVAEYEIKPGFPRTVLGKLHGHITIGFDFVRGELGGKLDDGVMLKLGHVILAHHGKLEWGSPVEPQTAEALAVFQADYLDSRMAGSDAALEGVKPGEWTQAAVGVTGSKMLRS